MSSSHSRGRGVPEATYDVIIIGGGPAGLSAALLLGRSCRSVLICDAGHPRNATATSFNGYLSRDGSTPAQFRAVCQRQLQRYPKLRFYRDSVMKVVRRGENFDVKFKNHQPARGRTILLATGLIDALPKIDGIASLYGKSVHSCPYCHGWECRGKDIGVLGNNKAAVELSMELGIWSSRVLLLTNGGKTPLGSQKRLRRSGVVIVNQRIRGVEPQTRKLLKVRMRDDSSIQLGALFLSPRQHQRCPIAKALGCKFSKEDGCIECDDRAFTGIPGVYAAGNASKGIQLVVMAAAEGAAAAVAINDALLTKDLKALRRASVSLSSKVAG